MNFFVGEYLGKNLSKLTSEDLDTPEKIEQSILSCSTILNVSTIRSDRNIDKLAEICSETVFK